MKRFAIAVLCLITGIALIFTGCKKKEEISMDDLSNSAVTTVTIETTVRTTGQYPEAIVATLDKDVTDCPAQASDFTMSGSAGMWNSTDTRPFSAEFSSVVFEKNTMTLYPKDFPEKFFYVEDFKIICDADPTLSFDQSKVEKVITPVADDFATFTTEEGAPFNYHLYTPEQTENMPIVVVFHGFGDTDNLLTYRTAVEWAEAENQAVRPCYVLAPFVDGETYYTVTGRSRIFEEVKKLLDQMIDQGKVDPGRIYVMGNSFGGMSTIEFAEKYPEVPAGLLVLCPALTYSKQAVSHLENMKDVPIWFTHATNDNTIPVTASREAVEKLESLGAKEVHFTEYSDDEMNAAGGDPAPDATYSYHHVELAVMEDDSYMDWLYGLRKVKR